MERIDILLWPDGFWCFREEYSKETLRDENYRVIPSNSPEWIVVSSKPAISRPL